MKNFGKYILVILVVSIFFSSILMKGDSNTQYNSTTQNVTTEVIEKFEDNIADQNYVEDGVVVIDEKANVYQETNTISNVVSKVGGFFSKIIKSIITGIAGLFNKFID